MHVVYSQDTHRATAIRSGRSGPSMPDPFDLESSLRQADFLFAGGVTTTAAIRV
jgi:hypothetical protein